MTFEEILDQAIAMLQRQGRVSYRALKRQFDLDDSYLEDLKGEIIDVHQVAIDQGGTMLVWTGGAGTTPSQTEPQTAPRAARSTTEAPPPETLHEPDAERRQLTVLFCDLVGSTALSAQLDPEELREVVRAYQDTCTKVIARFDGHIAQYLGDGLLVYFGYPLAHEDDVQRAVRSGLGMIDALGQLNTRLEQERGVRLAARLGIHTGLVVVGEVGGGPRQEQLALGETPNLAARLQGIAAPNTLVISATTFQLLGGFFACQPLGTPPLKGQAQPLAIYRVLYESMARSRLEAARSTGWTPLVGREQESGLLLERWAQVKEGVGQVVLLSGEAGIGKSRLVQVLQEHVATEPQVWLTPCQCSPYYQNTALYPLTEAGLPAQAMPYWQQAAQHAIERSANLEAIGHITKGLEVLKPLPDTPERSRTELHLQITLGAALTATKGFASPEVEQVYMRARQLCQQVGEPAQLFRVLRGLGTFYMNRAQLQTARELAEQRLHLAQRLQDPTPIAVAHNGMVLVLYHMGEFGPALAHFERALTLADPEASRVHPLRGWSQPNMVSCLSHAAWALWFLGAVDLSLARSQQALALAQQLEQPFNLANGRYWAAQLHQFRRDRCRTRALAEAVMALSEKEGFAQQVAQGLFLRGWALAKQGQVATGWSQMCNGFAAWEATGAEVLRPYYLTLLAEVAAHAGEITEGLRLLDEALKAVEKSGERSWQAEVHRLRGELLWRQATQRAVQRAATEEAEACLHQAIATARHQSAKSLELRAAMSLARLWQQQGKRAEARALLAPIYGWFAEGFDTADLQEAKALLEMLA